jgi:hypothetical protein
MTIWAGGCAVRKGPRRVRERRRGSRTRPGTGDTATSKTDLASSTPICILGKGTPPPVGGLSGPCVLLARWCRLGDESIPSHGPAERVRFQRKPSD